MQSITLTSAERKELIAGMKREIKPRAAGGCGCTSCFWPRTLTVPLGSLACSTVVRAPPFTLSSGVSRGRAGRRLLRIAQGEAQDRFFWTDRPTSGTRGVGG